MADEFKFRDDNGEIRRLAKPRKRWTDRLKDFLYRPIDKRIDRALGQIHDTIHYATERV